MRSISLRAGWCKAPKNVGSAKARRNTGICKRANHTRTLGKMRSSERMLKNISATISTVAFSTGVLAACFRSVVRSRTTSTAFCTWISSMAWVMPS